MNILVSWMTFGAAMAVGSEVLRATYVAYIRMIEHWAIACSDLAMCHVMQYSIFHSECATAYLLCPKGQYFGWVEYTLEEIRWCFGMDCVEAFRDAKSTVMFLGAVTLFILWQSGLFKHVVLKWWRERDKRDIRNFSAIEDKNVRE